MRIPPHSLVVNVDRPTLERYVDTPFLWYGFPFPGSRAYALVEPDEVSPSTLRRVLTVVDLDAVDGPETLSLFTPDYTVFFESEWSGKWGALATAVAHIFVWRNTDFDVIKQNFTMTKQEVVSL